MADHLTTGQLLLASDGEAGTEAESHLAACSECRERLDEIRESLAEYTAWHRNVLRTTLPAPPRAWRDVAAPSRAPLNISQGQPYRWMALAAAIVIAIVVMWPSRRAESLEASELISRAEAAERPSSSARRIVVRSSKGTLIRPAVWIRNRPAGDHPLQPRFRSAGYSWDEPLSVRSYAAWRRGLARRQDSVTRSRNAKTSEPVYVLTTQTDASTLKSATLSLRERDLQPVSGTLRFTDEEVVEMEEGSADSSSQPSEPDPRPSRSIVTDRASDAAVTPMQQLQVLVALHSIGADLGEPIQMETQDGKVVLSATGIGSSRRAQIAKALEGLEFVEQRFESSGMAPPSSRLRTEASAPNQNTPIRQLVEQQLKGSVGFEQFTNDTLDASDALSSRAHALAALATRFPAAVESELPSAGRQLLDSLRRDHIRSSSDHAAKLAGLLLNGFGVEASSTEVQHEAWQVHASRFRDSVQNFDTLLTGMLTGARAADREPLRESFSRLQIELQTLAGAQ